MRTALALCGVLCLAACSEPAQTVQYRDGRYAGKPDTPAWQADQFGNDRAQWERAIKTRNLRQSEFTRAKGSS